MKTFRHLDADYTPNDIGPSEGIPDTRTAQEIGDSESQTSEERI